MFPGEGHLLGHMEMIGKMTQVHLLQLGQLLDLHITMKDVSEEQV